MLVLSVAFACCVLCGTYLCCEHDSDPNTNPNQIFEYLVDAWLEEAVAGRLRVEVAAEVEADGGPRAGRPLVPFADDGEAFAAVGIAVDDHVVGTAVGTPVGETAAGVPADNAGAVAAVGAKDHAVGADCEYVRGNHRVVRARYLRQRIINEN